jgi:hypothetical protein
MENLLLTALVILLCYNVVKAIIVHMVWKQTVEETRAKIGDKIRIVQLEKLPTHANLILAYDAENHNFLGQGFTEDEIKSNIMNRYPSHIFILNERIFSAIKELPIPNEESTEISNAR